MSKKLPDNVAYERKQMFKIAFLGIKTAVLEEKNLQFDLFMAIVVITCGWLFKVSQVEWCLLFFAICQVLVAEMVNTIIENIVDWICPNYDLRAKKVKDLACGMVLMACIFSAIIGLIIFIPYVFR